MCLSFKAIALKGASMGELEDAELVYSLIGFPAETEWIEFKEGNTDPDRVARDICALANSAALLGREFAYKLWGIEDATHAIVGTSFDPYTAKGKGSQGLLIWLRSVLTANASYSFSSVPMGCHRVVVLKVQAPVAQPVYYDGHAYIREGSSTARLVVGSAKEALLWKKLLGTRFEEQVALEDVAAGDIQELLDVPAYYELLGLRHASSTDSVLAQLEEQGYIARQDNGRYRILNLGALVIAKSLSAFPGLFKRPLRVIRFDGNASFGILNDMLFDEGYAICLNKAERHIMALIPAREVVDGPFRRIEHAIPQRTVRELLSNALIHQDLTDSSCGPVVNIYDNRIEFLNPGQSLIPLERVLNAQPKSRNPKLARQMRLMGLCEEGGTGWDLAVAACEDRHLPAPKLVCDEHGETRATAYSERPYAQMSKAERRDALYWHACLLYAQGSSMSNGSLRARFGIGGEEKDVVSVSRLIRECCEAGLIKAEDASVGAKYRRYVPGWA